MSKWIDIVMLLVFVVGIGYILLYPISFHEWGAIVAHFFSSFIGNVLS